MADFWEHYKHPLWQEKRLKIMQSAGFRCERCRSTVETLNVHHAYYERGKRPWEYPDELLHCWCETCHREVHNMMKTMSKIISRLSVKDSRALLKVAESIGPRIGTVDHSMIVPVAAEPVEKHEAIKRRLRDAKSHDEAREILKELKDSDK